MSAPEEQEEAPGASPAPLTESSPHVSPTEKEGNAPRTEGEGGMSGVERRLAGARKGAFTPEKAREAALESVRVRRERKAEREAEAHLAGLTARQRLGLAVSKLTQAQLDAVIQRLAVDAAAGDTKAVHALARVLDQSFGRAQEEAPQDGRDADEKAWEDMSPAERAAYRAALLEQVARERADATPAGRDDDPRVTNE